MGCLQVHEKAVRNIHFYPPPKNPFCCRLATRPICLLCGAALAAASYRLFQSVDIIELTEKDSTGIFVIVTARPIAINHPYAWKETEKTMQVVVTDEMSVMRIHNTLQHVGRVNKAAGMLKPFCENKFL